jgi:FdhD protein
VLRGGVDPGEGFCLITSRCSVELVQKAVIGGMRTLVSVSAPTSMAIDLASRAGLGLIAVARPDGCTVFAGAPFDETDDTDMAFPGAPT